MSAVVGGRQIVSVVVGGRKTVSVIVSRGGRKFRLL